VSLILDALNRSRQDTDEVPGLATQHYMESAGQSRRPYPLWLALAVALAIIIWLVVDRNRGPVLPAADVSGVTAPPRQYEMEEAAAPASAPPPAVPTRIEPQRETAVAAPAMPAARQSAETETRPVAPTQAATGEAAVVELYQQRQQPAPVEAGHPVQPPAELASEPSPVTAPQPVAAAKPAVSGAERPIDIEQVLLEARDEVENARLEEHRAPFLSELSQQTKDQIPTIIYERHDYSGNPSQSAVVLNGKSVKVGGSAAAGVKLDEILPDSIVLNYRGTQFRLRALNSWVNL